MRRLIVTLSLSTVLTLGLVGVAFGHTGDGDPCATTAAGHSAYAHHHIVVLAHDQGLGAGGHIPGEHMGYHGLCG